MKGLFLVILFLSNICYGQKQINYLGFASEKHNAQIKKLHGNWGIDKLITNQETKDYTLSPTGKERFNYGNNLSLKADQTFESYYSAPCGNDCFTTSTGKYKIIDENYICFFLEKITRSGECIGSSSPNIDLGLFFYYKNKLGQYVFSKSKGTLQRDKDHVHSRDLPSKKKNNKG